MTLEHVRVRLGLGEEAAAETAVSIAALQLDRGRCCWAGCAGAAGGVDRVCGGGDQAGAGHAAVIGWGRRGGGWRAHIAGMRVLFLVTLLVAGCSAPGASGPSGLRTDSSTEALDVARGPGATVPVGNIGAPMAGISRRCTPNPSGTMAECRAY